MRTRKQKHQGPGTCGIWFTFTRIGTKWNMQLTLHQQFAPGASASSREMVDQPSVSFVPSGSSRSATMTVAASAGRFLGQHHISTHYRYHPRWHIDQPPWASNQPWLWTTLRLVFLVGVSVVRKPVQELFLHPVSLLLVFHHSEHSSGSWLRSAATLWPLRSKSSFGARELPSNPVRNLRSKPGLLVFQ